MRREMADMVAKSKELVERLNTSQNNVFRSRQQLDTIKEEMQWNEQELDAWLVCCASRACRTYLSETQQTRECLK